MPPTRIGMAAYRSLQPRGKLAGVEKHVDELVAEKLGYL